MVKYWKWQQVFDVLAAIIITAIVLLVPKLGFPMLIVISADGLALAARAWVGPALTLLGMMSATTAFIFSVVDRREFIILKSLGVESQLWGVFSENILWLGVAAISAAVVTFIDPEKVNCNVLIAVTFLFWMVVICISKFVWIMRQIISVRASKGN